MSGLGGGTRIEAAASRKGKSKKGFFRADGRYRMIPNEVLTIATVGGGCLVEITADSNGEVNEINICALREKEVKLAINGDIKG